VLATLLICCLVDSSQPSKTPRSRTTADHGTVDERTQSDMCACITLFRWHRVPNQMNSALDGLSRSQTGGVGLGEVVNTYPSMKS